MSIKQSLCATFWLQMQITTSSSASASTAAAGKAWELCKKTKKQKIKIWKKNIFYIAANVKLRQCLFVCSASVWLMWCVCVCMCMCMCACVRPLPRLPLSCALFWHQVDKTFHSQPKMRNHNVNKRDVNRVRGRKKEWAKQADPPASPSPTSPSTALFSAAF